MSQRQPISGVLGCLAARQDEAFGTTGPRDCDPSVSTTAFKPHALGTTTWITDVEGSIHARGSILYAAG